MTTASGVSRSIERQCRAALKRLYRSIDEKVDAAHERTATLGSHHRRALAQRWRWLARELGTKEGA